MSNDKKAQLILTNINYFKYGKRHIERQSFYHKVNYRIYKVLNALLFGVFGTELYASELISEDIQIIPSIWNCYPNKGLVWGRGSC